MILSVSATIALCLATAMIVCWLGVGWILAARRAVRAARERDSWSRVAAQYRSQLHLERAHVRTLRPAPSSMSAPTERIKL